MAIGDSSDDQMPPPRPRLLPPGELSWSDPVLKSVEFDLWQLHLWGIDAPEADSFLRSIEDSRRELLELRGLRAGAGEPLPEAEVRFVVDGSRLRVMVRSVGDDPLRVVNVAAILSEGDAAPIEDSFPSACEGVDVEDGEACVVEFDIHQQRGARLFLNHDGKPSGPFSLDAVVAESASSQSTGSSAPAEEIEAERARAAARARAEVAARQLAERREAESRASEELAAAEAQRLAREAEAERRRLEEELSQRDGALPDQAGSAGSGTAGEASPGAAADAGGEGMTSTFAIVGGVLLAMIVAAAVFVGSPSPFQFKVFNTTLAAGAAMVVTAVVRATGLPEGAAQAVGSERFAGFASAFTQGGTALVTFFTVYLAHPLQRLAEVTGRPEKALPLAATGTLPLVAGDRSVFISYRRASTADVTGRIYEHLVGRYGDRAVFKDVNDIPLGDDSRETLTEALGACKVVLVVIGKEWALADDEGRRRLDDPRDFVRLEVISALERQVKVIPLLVQGAEMPSPDELPKLLEALAFRNGRPIRPDPDFANDMETLQVGIDEILAG